MSYPPEPAPELSALEDMHRLQRHAASLGYVAVPRDLLEGLLGSASGGYWYEAAQAELERIERMPK